MPAQQEDEQSLHGQGAIIGAESSTTTSQNPAVFGHQPAEDEPEASPAVVVDIEAALKAGTVTEREAIVLMEQQMKQMQEKLTKQFADQGAPIESGVRSVLARLANAPCNWHQATVHYASSTAAEDALGKAMAPLMLAAGVAMVLGQLLACSAVCVGMTIPACASSGMCSAGLYCDVGANFPRCKYCGGDPPFQMQVSSAPGTCTFEPHPNPAIAAEGVELSVSDPACETLNVVRDPNFAGYNATLALELCAHPTARDGTANDAQPQSFAQSSVVEWCARCVHPLDGSVDPVEYISLTRMNIDAMGSFDWTTLWFASCIIALKLAGELKDIHMCELAIARAGDKLSVGWRIALRLLGGFRRWCFVTNLVFAVGLVVLLQGGDALSICFNTVALLFLTEIDNMAYAIGLSEQARKRVEVEGRVELSEEDTALLLRSKVANMIAIVGGIGWIVVSRHMEGGYVWYALSWLAGVVASIKPSPRETAKGMARATAACLTGLVVNVSILIYSIGKGT